MAHSHSHADGDNSAHDHTHDHTPKVTADSERRIFWVMCLTGGYMILQALGGLLAGSLALIADSGHMLSDTAALGLAWFAFRLASKPADSKRSYGYHRFQILAAFTNGLTLFFIAGWIVIEAIDRLIYPGNVLGGPMLVVACGGLVINIAGFYLLHRGDRENVNMQGALLHVMGDLLGSIAAIAAAVIILFTGWMAADPILSILVAVIILKSAYGLVRRSGHILLEGTPDHLDMELIREKLIAYLPQILDVHHMHAWSLTAEKPIITMHVQTEPSADLETTLRAINVFLLSEFEIDHATVQIEHGNCATGN
ncbi:cation diffusion facilitator family transporter [Sneathiella chungangensis]|uniref:Cation diffusion facilitator family transporter n=1 Tax=Sneathiella chungangensis TaxID=1418234 RepID=A0A845MHK7_9PROT|nr:cation diffusion facilitator family transporter [Sneathiella chungangensis]MZR23309.1 cation diffusion facilitator family transporter [Sneathiella chungangensis]